MLSKLHYKKLKAFSLTEILLAISLFALIMGSVSGFVIDTLRFSENNWNRVFSALKLQEISNAVIVNKNSLWLTLVQSTNGGNKYMQLVNNKYDIFNGQITEGDITYYFNVVYSYRDSGGHLTTVATGNTIDNFSRALILTATWTDSFGTLNTFTQTFYVTNWKSFNWNETSVADFTSGDTVDAVAITNTAGGEVQQTSVLFANWCRPSLTISSYDLPGQGVAKAIMAEPGDAYAGTGENASGISMIHATIDNNDPPNVTVPGSFNGYKTNGLYGIGSTGFIATDTNDREAAIINLSNFTESGYFDAPGNTDGISVFATATRGYLTTANNKLYIFDLTSTSGSRPELGNLTLAGNGSKITVIGSYAYISITGGGATDLQIIDITNAAAPTVVGTANINGGSAVDVFVNAAATRAYIATARSTTLAEFFIVDVSTKTGARPTISSYDTGDMDPKGVIATPDGTQRGIIVGLGGEEYQVIDMTTESSLTRCGGIEVNTGVYGIAPVTNTVGNVYSYIVTGDSSAEFKILRGGQGGGNAQGLGYPPTGTYTSSIFDTTSTMTIYYTISWNETTAPNSDLRFQIRTGNTADLSGAQWVGPDGTSATYFTDPNGEYINSTMNNKRYVQYKAYFNCYDTINTYIAKDVNINYQK
jgi:hypothetical protein